MTKSAALDDVMNRAKYLVRTHSEGADGRVCTDSRRFRLMRYCDDSMSYSTLSCLKSGSLVLEDGPEGGDTGAERLRVFQVLLEHKMARLLHELSRSTTLKDDCPD